MVGISPFSWSRKKEMGAESRAEAPVDFERFLEKNLSADTYERIGNYHMRGGVGLDTMDNDRIARVLLPAVREELAAKGLANDVILKQVEDFIRGQEITSVGSVVANEQVEPDEDIVDDRVAA